MPVKIGKKKIYLSQKKRIEDIEKGEATADKSGRFIPGLWLANLYNRKERNKEAAAAQEIYDTKQEEGDIVKQRQGEHESAEADFNALINKWPELASNAPLIAELKDTLGIGLKKLEGVSTEVRQEGGKYLSELQKNLGYSKQELKRGETEARTGIDKGLGIYRNLAKQTYPPGQQAMEDQFGEQLASGISDVKKYGGGRGLSAITDLYQNKLQQSRALGIDAANFQTQNKLNLAGSETQAGLSMADIIRENALSTAGMSQNFYSAQSDYLNKIASAETNVADTTMNIGKTMYDVNAAENLNQYQYNELAPAQLKAGFLQNKYSATDPFATQMDVLGRNLGYAYSDKWTAEQAQQENNKMLFNLVGEGLKMYLTGGLSGAGGAFKSGQGFSSSPNFSSYYQSPKGVNEFTKPGGVNQFKKYTPFSTE